MADPVIISSRRPWDIGWTPLYSHVREGSNFGIRHFLTVGEIRAGGGVVADISGTARSTAGGLPSRIASYLEQNGWYNGASFGDPVHYSYGSKG
jgi:hypothetical protein